MDVNAELLHAPLRFNTSKASKRHIVKLALFCADGGQASTCGTPIR
jgi:hypothetical protein